MNSRTAFWVAVCLFLSGFLNVGAQEERREKRNQLIGTWRLVSTKYGETKEQTDYPATSMRVKIINPTHFAWMEIQSGSKKVISSAGGKYTLAGHDYTELIDFVGDGMETYLGKAQKFTVRLEGEKLYLAGELSDGSHIEEVWARMK